MKMMMFLMGVEMGAEELSLSNTPAVSAPAPAAKRI
jgi:hypothetical protein